MYNSPKDSGIVYQDSKMYSSPAQMHQLPHNNEHQMYAQGTPGEEMDMHNLGMFGTIDPNNLGHQPQRH